MVVVRMEIIHRQVFENSFCLKIFWKIVLEILYSALNGCRLDDMILAYAGTEYSKIGLPIVYGFFLNPDAGILIDDNHVTIFYKSH